MTADANFFIEEFRQAKSHIIRTTNMGLTIILAIGGTALFKENLHLEMTIEKKICLAVGLGFFCLVASLRINKYRQVMQFCSSSIGSKSFLTETELRGLDMSGLQINRFALSLGGAVIITIALIGSFLCTD